MLTTAVEQKPNVTQSREDRIAIAQRGYATPAGPPPQGFRLKPKPRWDQEKESTADKMGKYFLLLEMARGMYVLLEQFFRPP